jgi:cytoplasmic iron level regulating protein YaaA (DUF328/UPF0246 family)
MLFLLAPSKTQNFNGRDFPLHFQPLFPDKTRFLTDRLSSLTKEELSLLMKTGKKLTETTYKRFHRFEFPHQRGDAHQAFFTFQGDVYSGLETESYTREQLFYSQEHIFILSGLYGILRPLDLMYPYRLEMATKFVTPKGGNLYHFWSDTITAHLNRTLRNSGSSTIINLASKEYSRTVLRKKLQGKMIEVIFQQKKNSIYKTIPIYSKRARGLFAHFAITDSIINAADLKDFNLGGYRYMSENSTRERWVFRREEEN